MSTVRERATENITGIVSICILGAGFVALFANLDYFWIIWVLGFAVVLPLIAMLSGEDEADEGNFEQESHQPTDRSDNATPDALSTLRNRYARGDLTDEQFERKLDALFETENPESAAEWRTRDRERIEERP